MLKRLLASLAIVSLLIAAALLVYTWRSKHGYQDSYTLGKGSSTVSKFTFAHEMLPTTNLAEKAGFFRQIGGWFSRQLGTRITVEVTSYQGSVVQDQMHFYPLREFLGYCLIVPGLWLAIKIRNWLPRPPGMETNAKGRMQKAERRKK